MQIYCYIYNFTVVFVYNLNVYSLNNVYIYIERVVSLFKRIKFWLFNEIFK